MIHYCIDENLPPGLLEGLDVSSSSIRDTYGQGVKDPEWIPDIGRKGWIVVTRDVKMSRFRVHRADLEHHGVTVLFLPKGPIQNKKALVQKEWCAQHWDKIHAFVGALSDPSGIRVSSAGECSLLWTKTMDGNQSTDTGR